MSPQPLAPALARGPVVLDGGMATRLEARGHDLSDALWSARLLLDDPAEIVEAHRDFVRAGARVLVTTSYQVSFTGFAAAGFDAATTEATLRRSVDLAREAFAAEGVDGWVAASIGPYAASLADGSEYRADHGRTVAQLRDWHRRRLDVLCAAGPDVLAIETIAGATEAEALLEEVAGRGIPAWLSMTCAGDRLRSGEDPVPVWRAARDVPEVIAVGVNCTDPRDLPALLPPARAESALPLVAYPNSGEGWDGIRRTWVGESGFDADAVCRWLASGARLVGGCCRVTPAQMADITRVVRGTASAQ
ncbi:MAG: homocysteine S-methyltransferase [Dermatophilaceae bacterium]